MSKGIYSMSSNVQYQITPYTITTITTIKSMCINLINLTLGTSATFSIQLYDENGNMFKNQMITLIDAAYTNWGGDDDYVIQYIATYLGSSYPPA